MKRIVLLTLFLAGAILLHAQSEAKADTLDVPPAPAADAGSSLLPSTVKSYGGFLLDMGAMNLPERPSLSNFKLTVPDASKDYSFLLRPQTDAIYSQSTWPMFASPYYGFWDTPTTLQMRSVRLKNYSQSTWPMFASPYYGFWDTPTTLQMRSVRLKNGWMLNTYGEYDADGRRVPNPSALPWQRNNFKGAFELKSQDGSFGIRVEVQRGRENPF